MSPGTEWEDDGGPAGPFLEAARRLGLTPRSDDVYERFDAHESPGSLRALADVAASFGVEARAFRADADGLGDAAVPAVVHLQVGEHGAYAFALLAEVGAADVMLDRGDGAGVIPVSRAAFLREWTGIVVSMALKDGAVVQAPRAGLLWRLRRALLEGESPLHHRAARALAGLTAVGLAVRTAWGLGALGPTERAFGLAALAALLGGGLAAWALYYKARVTAVPSATPRLASKICGRGKVADCAGVLSSRWARVLGVDLASVGVAIFAAALGTLAAAGLVEPAPRLGAVLWLGVFACLAAPGSLFFAGVQFYPLRRFCPLCMAVHAVVVAGAAAAIALAVAVDDPQAVLLASLPWAVVPALMFAAAFALLVPYLDLDLEARTNRVRLGWIASTPWGALAEMLGRPRATRRRPDAAISIGAASAPFRIEALVHPMCSGCGPVVEQLVRLERDAAGVVAIGFHLPPRDPFDEADREMCAAVTAIGLAAGGHAALRAFLTLKKKNPWKVLAEAHGRAGEIARIVAPAGSAAVDEAHLTQAGDAVRRADELAEELARGTPTLLLEGRPWEAPVEDLARLLTRHADVVAALLRLRPAPTPARGAATEG